MYEQPARRARARGSARRNWFTRACGFTPPTSRRVSFESPRCRVGSPNMASAQALLLIADIGGYTDYMGSHRMSLGHVVTNLCPCDDCARADNLKLKFVAHIGEVATQTVNKRRNLVGIDVIFVHRLLKNPVQVPEYVLLSEELYRSGDAALPDPVHEVRTSRESGPSARTTWTSRTSRAHSRRRRIPPGSDASAGRQASPAAACRTCWACGARCRSVTGHPNDPAAAISPNLPTRARAVPLAA